MKTIDELPKLNEIVIAYKADGSYYFARYGKVLTWKGYKLKFINILSKGFWHDDVVGWNHIPSREQTI